MKKLSAAHKAHLPSYVTKDEETLEDFLSDFSAVRMVHGVVKMTPGDTYYYRGVEITQDEGVPKGYYGRFRVGSKHGDDSLEGCKRYIDGLLDKKVCPRCGDSGGFHRPPCAY